MNAPSKNVDRQTFLTTVRQSGLLGEQQMLEAETLVNKIAGGRAAARVLIEQGMLTKFQAERLLAGRSSGYILGQYKILDQLGRGGMGQVFKAEHRTMSRIVALKVLAPGLIDTERAQEMFLREVRAVASLVHPNIVTAFDANTIQGRHYLVLEFVDGPNLDQLVKQEGPLPIGLACDYVLQVAQGLQCAHSQRMVHRDIKPANLLVQRRGTSDQLPALVKISDFGLARFHTPKADQGPKDLSATIMIGDNTVMGTPDYLSPEQARSLHTTDIRSDIYSLGCTFHFLLSGQVPYPNGSSLEKLIRHSSEPLVPISKLRPEVPPEVEAIILKMVAEAPDDRFQSPADLAAALSAFAVRRASSPGNKSRLRRRSISTSRTRATDRSWNPKCVAG